MNNTPMTSATILDLTARSDANPPHKVVRRDALPLPGTTLRYQ